MKFQADNSHWARGFKKC